VFLDPPYLGDVRTKDLYRVDDHEISHAVREWCLKYGDDPRYRIVLAGYRSEGHGVLESKGWMRTDWKAGSSYQTASSAGKNANPLQEALWMSPACLNEMTLF
jgi:hypothetical protein